MIHNIREFANLVADKLQIDLSNLITIIDQKKININEAIDESINDKIRGLLKADDDINNFDKYIKTEKVGVQLHL